MLLIKIERYHKPSLRHLKKILVLLRHKVQVSEAPGLCTNVGIREIHTVCNGNNGFDLGMQSQLNFRRRFVERRILR